MCSWSMLIVCVCCTCFPGLAFAGIIASSDGTGWICSVCNDTHKHLFAKGMAGNIQHHVDGSVHKAKKERTQSVAFQPKGSDALAMLQQRASQQARYHVEPSFAIHSVAATHDFISKKNCHGYFHDVVSYGSQEHDITTIKMSACCMPGSDWYAVPNYNKDIQIRGKQCVIKGTLRHVNCEGFFFGSGFACEACSSIPNCADLRSRIHRGSKVGERAGSHGVNYTHMNRMELQEVARDMRYREKAYRKQVFHLSRELSIQRSKGRTVDVTEVATEAIEQGDVGKVLEVFKRCASVGAFDGKSPLLHFLLDLGKNLLSLEKNGNAKGFRYSKETKAFYEMLWHLGGRLVHEFCRSNLLGPSLMTSKAAYRSTAFHYDGTLSIDTFVSVLDLIEQVKREKGIDGPVPMEIAEDETAIIPVATYNRRTDTIDGFCGPKGEAHRCSFDCKASAASCESICTAFDTLVVAKNIRLLVVNVLVPRFPRFPLAALPCCLKFNAAQVLEQWLTIRSNLKQHGSTVGCIVSHASDGDHRRRKLQLDSMRDGVYGLDRPGFLLKGEKVDGEVILMDQDAIHCAKKWRNSSLHPHRKVMYGTSLAHKNLLLPVLKNFSKEEHGLLEDDINPADLQNFPAAQRLAFPKVRDCLRELPIKAPTESHDCKGLILHLHVMWAFLEVFFGNKSLIERVKLASFVIHMVFLGYAFVLHAGHGLTVAQNWMPKETCLDILIAMHFAINLIRLHRDKFPHLPVHFSRAGTDCCEDLFADVGQQTRNKHNATPGEFLERCSQLVRREALKSDTMLGLKYAGNKRRENLWHKGNGYPTDAEAKAALDRALRFFAHVSDAACCGAWDAGFDMARDEARKVGMADVLIRVGLWDTPWMPFLTMLQNRARAGNQPEAEVDEATADDDGYYNFADGHDGEGDGTCDEQLVGQIRAAVVDAVQELDDLQKQAEATADGRQLPEKKISPYVYVPALGGMVHKMRLVAEMNQNPGKIPLDRLQRVRQHTVNGQMVVDSGGEVGLFDNICVCVEGKDGMWSWYLAKVLVMTKETDTGGRVDYQLPVSLDSTDRSLKLTVKYYKAVDDSNKLFSYGGFEGEENDPVALSSVIARVCTLTMDANRLFVLGDSEHESFTATVEQNNQALLKKRKKRKDRQEEAAANADVGVSDSRVGGRQTRSGRQVSRFHPFIAEF